MKIIEVGSDIRQVIWHTTSHKPRPVAVSPEVFDGVWRTVGGWQMMRNLERDTEVALIAAMERPFSVGTLL